MTLALADIERDGDVAARTGLIDLVMSLFVAGIWVGVVSTRRREWVETLARHNRAAKSIAACSPYRSRSCRSIAAPAPDRTGDCQGRSARLRPRLAGSGGETGWFGHWFLQHGIRIIYAVPGMVIATVFVSMPFVVREVQPVLQEVGSFCSTATA